MNSTYPALYSYDLCMRTRQQLLAAYAAIPADQYEEHWLHGRVRSRDLAKGAVVAWLMNATARARTLHARS